MFIELLQLESNKGGGSVFEENGELRVREARERYNQPNIEAKMRGVADYEEGN